MQNTGGLVRRGGCRSAHADGTTGLAGNIGTQDTRSRVAKEQRGLGVT